MLRTDDQVAHPAVPANLRDLGGLPTESGGRTRPGVLLRSAAPYPGDADPDTVPVWPPTDVIDLRSPSELRGRPHPLERPGTRVHALPMLSGPQPWDDGDWSTFPDLPTVYPWFLDSGAEQVVRTLRVAARAEGPVLVHCAAGKDRTGITVAVLLRAAGVPRDVVLADYVRTELHMADVLARDETDRPEDPTHLQRLMGAPPEAITTILELLDQAAVGADDPDAGWLLAHGATAEDLAGWRRRILG